MVTKRDMPTVTRLMVGKAFVAHAAAAIHVATLKANRIVPLREVAAEGVAKLLTDTDYEIYMCLKIHAKYESSGPANFWIGVTPEELAAIDVLRPRLRVLSMLDISRPTAVKLAIIRMTRFETKDDDVEAAGISHIQSYLHKVGPL